MSFKEAAKLSTDALRGQRSPFPSSLNYAWFASTTQSISSNCSARGKQQRWRGTASERRVRKADVANRHTTANVT